MSLVALVLMTVAAPPAPIDEGLRARAERRAGNAQGLLEAVRGLEALYPGSPELPVLRGEALARLGDRPGAIAAYRQALALDPGHPAALYALVVEAAQADRRDDALALLGRALRRAPDHASRVERDPDLAGLRSDPRLAPLLADARRHPAPELMVQSGQSAMLAALAVSRDGRILATAGATVDVWDLASGKQVWALGGGAYSPGAVALSPDGALVAAPMLGGDLSSRLVIWSLGTGAVVAELPLGKASPQGVAFSPDGRQVAAGGTFGGISLFDLATRRRLAHFASKGDLGGLLFDPSGRYVLAGSYKGVHVFDTAQPGAPARILPAGREWAYAAAFTPDGGELVIGSDDGKIAVVEFATGALRRTFERKNANHRFAAVSPDGRLVALSASSFNTAVFDLATGAERSVPSGADGPIAFVPGTALLAAGRGRDVALFDPETGAEQVALAARAHAVAPVAFSPDGALLATGGVDGVVDLWDLPRARRLRSFRVSTWEVSALAFSADGAAIVSAQRSDYRPDLPPGAELPAAHWIPIDGRAARSLDGPEREVSAIARSPDGGHLAIAEHGGKVTIHDGRTGQKRCAAPFRAPAAARATSANRVAFLGDGRTFLVATLGGIFAKEYETATCRPIRESGFYAERVADGTSTHVLVASGNHLSRVDLATGLGVAKAQVADPITELARSPDGRHVAVASGSIVHLFAADTLTELLRLAGHQGTVRGVAFSADGRFLASTSHDGSTRLWELGLGTTLVSLIAIDGEDGIAATPEGWYSATKGALRGVAFRYQGRGFPFDQFDLKLNRPDLVVRRIGLAKPGLTEALRRAYERRLAATGLAEDRLDVDFALPVVTLDPVPLVSTSRTITLGVAVEDPAVELDRLQVFVNDVPLDVPGLALDAEATRVARRAVPIELGRGRNKIQVSARNRRGVESLRPAVQVTYDGPAEPTNLHVVAIGVSRYGDAAKSLEYAAKDARDLSKWFESKRTKIRDVKVTRLLDAEATKERVLAAREILGRSRVDDTVVVFVAGHGLLDEHLDYYFAPHDADFDEPARRGVTHEELEGLFQGVPARRRVLLMDTCHSGEVEEGPAPPAPAPRAVKVRAIRPRGLSRAVPGVGASDTSALVQHLFANLRRGSGAVVIAAAGGAEYALESGRWKNGVFTYAVLEGLRSRLADRDGDAIVRVSELRDYVGAKVPELTDGQQRPATRLENLELDFPLE